MSSFIQFAEAHGLIIDRGLIEGRWVRTKTHDHPKKRNGSYKLLGDVAFVQNFSTMDSVAVWRPDGVEARIDRAKLREMERARSLEQEKRYAGARLLAADMLKTAMLSTHPYLAKKGFPKEQGFVLDGELLIPMRDVRCYKTLNGLQRISPIGEKLFLTGMKARESVFMVGSFMARERWLCEGYATLLSLKAALDELRRHAQIVCCFSAGNLIAIGKWARELRTPAYVFADHDQSGAGQRAAEATGLPWVMAAEVGTDANDVHQRHGLRTLVGLIRGVEG